MMSLGNILHILCIDVKRQVVGIHRVPAVAAIVVDARIVGVGRLFLVALTRGDVGTTIGVDVQVLETMYLIVYLNIAKIDV